MEHYHIRQLVLYEKNFLWIAFWIVYPEGLGSLWLKAFANWGESRWLKASIFRERGSVRFQLYSLLCLTTEKKHKNLFYCSLIAKSTLRAEVGVF
jgi:hypothetical protein